jgi:hypothetical protein
MVPIGHQPLPKASNPKNQNIAPLVVLAVGLTWSSLLEGYRNESADNGTGDSSRHSASESRNAEK